MNFIGMNTLPDFSLKTNIIKPQLRLKRLAHLGRQLSVEILVAERIGDPRLDDLLRAKDRINKLLSEALEYINFN